MAASLRDELGADCDMIELEQHIDFLDGTAFRRTLVCRDAIRLNRDISAAPVKKLLVASQSRPLSPAPDFTTNRPEEFAARKGAMAATIRCDTPIGKAAILTLADAYPRAMPLEAVVAAAASRLGRSPSEDERREVRALVIGGFEVGAIELHTWQPETADGTSLTPEASPIARYELTYGTEVTNLWHERIVLGSAASRYLLAALDGRRNRTEIADQVAQSLFAELSAGRGGGVPAQAEVRNEVAAKIDFAITDLARAGVLIR
jgi:methyltransferase-like protein